MQLDMTNKQHVRLRKLLTDLHARHAGSLIKRDFERVNLFHRMLMGVERTCREVMHDTVASFACDEVMHHMLNMELAHQRIMRAAA